MIKYIIRKRSRAKTIQELMAEGNLDGIKRLFWDAHEGERQAKRKPYSRLYRRLRRLNGSTQVPALFQTQNKFVGEIDTFSTIIRVVDNEADLAGDEAEAIDDVLGWVEHVKGYKARFDKVIEAGFENNRLLTELEAKIEGKGRLTRNEFPQTLKVPIVNKGEVDESTITFEELEDLKDFIKEKKREINLTFAQNYMDEFFKKSRIYNVLLDQALFVRRLELVLERFNNIPLAKLSDAQLSLKKTLMETLESSEYQARKDAMDVVRKKEFRSEYWASLKFWRSQRVAKEAKYALPTQVLEQARELSPYGVMLRSAAILTVASTAIITPVTIIYNDNPWVMYVTSLVSNYFNDFLVNTVGMPSPALSSCYKSERAWSIEEASEMNNFVESHLSRYTAYQKIDKSYDPNKDQEYIKKKIELQALCSKKRLEYKAAARHVENKALLNEHGYRFAAHLILIELIQNEMSNGEEVSQALYEYFEQKELFEDEEKALGALDSLKDLTSAKFVEDIKEYQSNIEGMVPRIQAGDFPLYYPTSDDFLNSLKGD